MAPKATGGGYAGDSKLAVPKAGGAGPGSPGTPKTPGSGRATPTTSPRASPRASPKASPKATPRQTSPRPGTSPRAATSPRGVPKATASRPPSRRRNTDIVAEEIWKCLESHGVSPLSQASLSIEGELSRGRFKQVQKGVLKVGDMARDVVVLRYAREASEVREIEILSLLADAPRSGSFVPELYGAYNETKSTLIVQELARFGTLKTALTATENEAVAMTGAHKLRVLSRLADAMAFLESMRIVHGDLSCRNVLVCNLEEEPQETVVKITDFGLAVELEEGKDSLVRKQPMATRWCAPEVPRGFRLSYGGFFLEDAAGLLLGSSCDFLKIVFCFVLKASFRF
eukprot:TRINITY_DN22480_c0_g1_i3.p1 TRINITY_DN22480_c0_g1~~TRINITY_DN22480_c0_g1_i3.p1  ORF type:complete len:372 (-),score=62.08 TRINITY_DN22480_c0_g1_i3:2-1030(-)